MMHPLLYAEMNQAVPGASLSPGHEGGYGECQVPSPSQWSDPCYSPPSFHSPQHLPVELEKVKEEPFSPSSVASYLTLPPSPPTPHLSPSATHHGASPYARPSTGGGHVTKQDAYESCINLAELLNDNQSLIQQHGTSSSPSYCAGYPDHPLLRGRLEDTNAFQKISGASGTTAPAGGAFDGAHHILHHLEEPATPYHHPTRPASSSYKDTTSEGLSFLESLVDVKQEAEDDVYVGSSCGSPAVPSPGGSPGGQHHQREMAPQITCHRDILETVEILALEHNRRDVQRVSDSLNIPRDPAQWSVDDVRAWLKFQASQLELPPLSLDFWCYGGPSLLKLTEQQFRTLAPIGGELLYAKLEIWREAWRSSTKLSPSSVASPSSSPHHHHHHPYAFIHQHSPQEHHHLMVAVAPHQSAAAAAAHLQHLQHQQQQQQQQQGLQQSSGVSSPTSVGGSPASPPLPLGSPMSQVPTPVAQVSQQQMQQAASTSAPPSPQQQGTAGTAAVYLEEQCLDMTNLLQQPASSPKTTQANHNPTHCSQQDETYDSEDEMEEETCSSGGSGRGGTHIHLWQFLKELLQQPQLYGSCIRWLDRQKGVFKIEDSVRVARLWGKRKNRPAMNYDKLSRSIRQYYKKGIMKKTERSQRLVYQFCHPYCL